MGGGGYLTLFKKLYKIKKQHQKEKQIYQETIKVFPQLKYPNLETCPDYDQALRYKFHLSYMLGEVLIKADKTWHKGGGFKLKNNIKKVNKEFQIFREIFKEFDQINSSVLKGLIDNKQLFLKEFPRIKNILKIHQDYKAILDNIFHNFNYFIQNFDLIEEWLLSDDFKERYKKENHPYPSLLDPKKLNDNNEEINYHNIPAELAWEMNLPLPDRYEFVFWGGHGVGNSGFHNMMKKVGLKAIFPLKSFDGYERYVDIFRRILENKHLKLYIGLIDYVLSDGEKFHALIYPGKQISINLVRDPIGILRNSVTLVLKGDNYLDIVPVKMIKVENIFKNRIAYYGNSPLPNFEIIKVVISSHLKPFHDSLLKSQLINIKQSHILDMSEIIGEKVFDTMKYLSTLLNFPKLEDKDKDFFKEIFIIYRYLLPIHLEMKDYLKSPKSIIIIFLNIEYDFLYENYKKINNIFYFENSKYSLFISKDHYIYLKSYLKNDIILEIKKYIEELILYFEKTKEEVEDRKKYLEKDILNYFKENKKLAKEFKSILDTEHLPYIKQHRPDIVASWKYYQEFERMCKELDENNQNPSL
ncbi:sugar transferase [Campylobacter jejuni subsp. doylei]|nr:sugar transferase [Campylobacter jejuni subsp. doylei]